MQSAGLIWLFPLTFASAAFVPVASMPGWLQAFAKINPVTVICNVLRDLTLGGPTMVHFLQSVGLDRRDPARLRAACRAGLPAGGVIRHPLDAP